MLVHEIKGTAKDVNIKHGSRDELTKHEQTYIGNMKTVLTIETEDWRYQTTDQNCLT